VLGKGSKDEIYKIKIGDCFTIQTVDTKGVIILIIESKINAKTKVIWYVPEHQLTSFVD